jgi:hypothetical protein
MLSMDESICRQQHHARRRESLLRRARRAEPRLGAARATGGQRRHPVGPAATVGAFTEAIRTLKADRRIKFQIMKDLNQAQLGEIAAIYGTSTST